MARKRRETQPIFNEEAVIPVLLKRLDVLLEALDAPAEIIVVDDGSRDTSAIVIEAKARADKRYRLIILSRNFGHHVAITVGLDHAAGRAVIVMDGDLQDPPEVVLEIIAKWKQGYDVVSAERAPVKGKAGSSPRPPTSPSPHGEARQRFDAA